jgi:putative DNA primase/helicase
MAAASKAKPNDDLETAGEAIAGRFDALSWDAFNGTDRKARNTVRTEVLEIRSDLMKLGAVDMRMAAGIWDAHVPTFVPRPMEFDDPPKAEQVVNMIQPGRRKRRLSPEPWLDEQGNPPPDVDPGADPAPQKSQSKTEPTQPEAPPDPEDARKRLLFEGLDKLYLKADDRYHFRDRGREVAFEAQAKRLITAHETPAVVNSMIDLAEARGWTSLKLSGTDEFRREAWLQAKARGMDVTGYKPTDLDKVRLDELMGEFGKDQPGVNAVIDQTHRARNRTLEGFSDLAESGKSEPLSPTSASHDVVLKALETTMKARGDSPASIAMARDLAIEKLGKGRIHVGKLVSHGTGPYLDKSDNEENHFVVLEDDKGKQSKIWGVDLPRALGAGEASPGDKIALAFRGRQPVTVSVKMPNEDGKGFHFEKREVERTTWEAVKFDRLRSSAKEQLAKAYVRDKTVGVAKSSRQHGTGHPPRLVGKERRR